MYEIKKQIYLNLTVIAILFPKKKESGEKPDDRADGLSHKEINCSALEDGQSDEQSTECREN